MSGTPLGERRPSYSLLQTKKKNLSTSKWKSARKKSKKKSMKRSTKRRSKQKSRCFPPQTLQQKESAKIEVNASANGAPEENVGRVVKLIGHLEHREQK